MDLVGDPGVRGKRCRAARRGGGAIESGAGELGGPGGRLGRAGHDVDALGDVAQVLDRRGGAAGHADDLGARERRRVAEVGDVLDLDRGRPSDLAQPGQLLGVGARAPTDDDHQVDLTGRLEGVLLATDRDRADGVDDLELVGTRDHERRQLARTSRAAGSTG